ncbi:MAG: DUF3995 domain-containing protein [Solirubrobacteraceae bacterium]
MERSTEFASAGLAGLAGLHAVWAAGSSWPFRDKATLSDAVIGHDRFPSAAACLAVAGALAAGSAFVAGWPAGAPRLQRTGAAGVLAVLSVRSGLGLSGLTHLVSPGSCSERFRALDRRLYAPVCLALAVLAEPAARRRHPTS